MAVYSNDLLGLFPIFLKSLIPRECFLIASDNSFVPIDLYSCLWIRECINDFLNTLTYFLVVNLFPFLQDRDVGGIMAVGNLVK